MIISPHIFDLSVLGPVIPRHPPHQYTQFPVCAIDQGMKRILFCNRRFAKTKNNVFIPDPQGEVPSTKGIR